MAVREEEGGWSCDLCWRKCVHALTEEETQSISASSGESDEWRQVRTSLIINMIMKVLKQGRVDVVLTSAETRPTSAVGEFMWSDGLLSDITDTAGKEQSELPVISPAQTDRSKWANQNRAGFNHAV